MFLEGGCKQILNTPKIVNKVRTGKCPPALQPRRTLFLMARTSVEWRGNLSLGGVTRSEEVEIRGQTTLSVSVIVKRRDDNIWRGRGIGAWKAVSLTCPVSPR